MITQGYRGLFTARDRSEAKRLLAGSGLGMPESVDEGIGFFEDGILTGCAFRSGNLLCGICVAPSHRGTGLAAALAGKIMTHAMNAGFTRLCLYTKPEEADKFLSLGFSMVASTDGAALLEYGEPSFDSWCAEQKTVMRDAGFIPGKTNIAAVVMNANPFTRGHRFLAEKARETADALLVFVVEEDASLFPFAVRLELARKGLADLPGTLVLPSGPYMVSRSSFPSYFTGDERHAAVHARLDATLFARHIAPALGIRARAVGTEPFCPVTALYNTQLKALLPECGMALHEVPRLETAGVPVSASRVRELLARLPDAGGCLPELDTLLPDGTRDFFLTPEGRKLLHSIKNHHARH